MKKKNEYPMGSVSCGTMLKEDLIPAFLDVLQDLAEDAGNGNHLLIVAGIDNRIDTDPHYYDKEDSDYDLEDLFDALNEYAGPGCYFGANPGDGSDYGFWEAE